MFGATKRISHQNLRNRLYAGFERLSHKSAAYWLLEVWPILLTIAIIVTAIIIGFRIWRHKHDDLGKW